MDLLASAGAFGTIVQLICNFRQERGEAKDLDHQNFIEWLEYHRHDEIKTLICASAALQNEVIRKNPAKVQEEQRRCLIREFGLPKAS